MDDCVYGSFKCYKIDSAKFNALNLRDVVHQIPNEEKLQSKPLKIASNANRRSISIEAGVTGKFVNGELKLEQHEHSCAQQDAILYRSADGHAICNPYDPQYNCNYGDAESNKYKINPTTFMNDKVLLNILNKSPKTLPDLWAVDGFAQNYISSGGSNAENGLV